MRPESSLGTRRARAAYGTALGLGIALLAACGAEPTGPDPGGGGVQHRSALIVSGSVVDPSGTGIFGSIVRITVFEYQDGCSDQAIGAAFEGTANEVGQYSLNLTFDRDEFDACLAVEAIPPEGSGFQSRLEHTVDVDVNELGDGIRAVQLDFTLQRVDG